MTAANENLLPDPARPYLSTDRVRWADVDLVGIMRFSAFTRLVENAEQDMWRSAGLRYGENMRQPDVWMPRRNLSIEYTLPARIDDVLQLVTSVSRVGDSSLILKVDVMTDDFRQLYAAATVVTVCVNAKTWTKELVPAEFRKALAPYTLSAEASRAWVREHMVEQGQGVS